MRLAPSFLAECVLANSPASNDLHGRSEDQILEPEVNHNIFFFLDFLGVVSVAFPSHWNYFVNGLCFGQLAKLHSTCPLPGSRHGITTEAAEVHQRSQILG